MQSLQILSLSFFVIHRMTSAFIFIDDSSESVTLFNYKYNDKCLFLNETFVVKVNELKTKYEKIKSLSWRERELALWMGVEPVCEGKRDLARTMTDHIQPIGDFCVDDEKKRKDFVLNTLLLLETTLDFFCGMNVSHIGNNLERCFTCKSRLLTNCLKKSYNLYFWESLPLKLPTLVQLLNGAVCDFDFNKMLNCSKDITEGSTDLSCKSSAAVDQLSYQFDIIKRHSLCFKLKDVTEILENSSEDTSNIVAMN